MPKGEGNGQGNFSSKGRRTGPLRKVMQKEREENDRRKAFLQQQRDEAERDRKILLAFRKNKGMVTQ